MVNAINPNWNWETEANKNNKTFGFWFLRVKQLNKFHIDQTESPLKNGKFARKIVVTRNPSTLHFSSDFVIVSTHFTSHNH